MAKLSDVVPTRILASSHAERATQANQTGAIDRLFLELSQFTTAKTAREIALERVIKELLADMRSFDKQGTFAKLRSFQTAEDLTT